MTDTKKECINCGRTSEIVDMTSCPFCPRHSSTQSEWEGKWEEEFGFPLGGTQTRFFKEVLASSNRALIEKVVEIAEELGNDVRKSKRQAFTDLITNLKNI